MKDNLCVSLGQIEEKTRCLLFKIFLRHMLLFTINIYIYPMSTIAGWHGKLWFENLYPRVNPFWLRRWFCFANIPCLSFESCVFNQLVVLSLVINFLFLRESARLRHTRSFSNWLMFQIVEEYLPYGRIFTIQIWYDQMHHLPFRCAWIYLNWEKKTQFFRSDA